MPPLRIKSECTIFYRLPKGYSEEDNDSQEDYTFKLRVLQKGSLYIPNKAALSNLKSTPKSAHNLHILSTSKQGRIFGSAIGHSEFTFSN